MTEQQQRDAVIAEARTWMNTPYHHAASVKGAGVDCAFLLIKVFHACGLLPDIDPRPYPPDWMLHRDEERYLGWVHKFTRPVEVPKPGDVVLYRFARCISHGAIVLDWPIVIHAYRIEGVVMADGLKQPLGQKRLAGFHSLWGVANG